MREIKFRAWFEDEMIFSDCPTGEFEFVFDDSGSMEFNAWNDEKHKLTPDGDVTYAGWDTYTTDIMQYTGLKDKNGKEIYEDDIVAKFDLNDPYFRSKVVFRDGAFGYVGEFTGFVSFAQNYHFEWEDGKSLKIEVIGNIHDNPDVPYGLKS